MLRLTTKLFKWMCSITALHPMRMEIDESNGKLKGFTFSFSHSETWWYLLVLLVQLYSLIVTSFNLSHDLKNRLITSGHE